MNEDEFTDEDLAAWLYGFLAAFEPRDNPAIADPGSAKAYYEAALAMLRRQGQVDDELLADRMLGNLPARLTTAHRATGYGERHAKAARLAASLDKYDLGEEDE
jgi:hypothetical protein